MFSGNKDIRNIHLEPELMAELIEALRQYYGKNHASPHLYQAARLFNKSPFNSAVSFIENFFMAVISGDLPAVARALNIFPKLLFFRCTLVDHAREHTDKAAFQLMLSAEDNEMWQVAEAFFDMIPGGLDEMVKQYFEQFPQLPAEPKAKKPHQESTYDFEKFAHLITNDQDIYQLDPQDLDKMNDKTRRELENFRACFGIGEIRKHATGKDFDLRVCLHAINAYVRHRKHMSSQQSLFYLRRVIGGLQTLFSACWLQTCNTGLRNLVMADELGIEYDKIDRSLKISDTSRSLLSAISAEVPENRLGYGIFINFFHGGIVDGGRDDWFLALSRMIREKEFQRLQLEQRILEKLEYQANVAKPFLDDRDADEEEASPRRRRHRQGCILQ